MRTLLVELGDDWDESDDEADLVVDDVHVDRGRIKGGCVLFQVPDTARRAAMFTAQIGVGFDIGEGFKIQKTQMQTLGLDGERLRSKIVPPRYQGLLKASDVEHHPERIGFDPKSEIPINRILERFTARYFDVDAAELIVNHGKWIAGHTLEYEISREPLGWALDEWISTRDLAPHEDRVEAESAVEMFSTIQQEERLRQRIAEDQQQTEHALERGRIEQRSSAHSSGRGLSTGFGGGGTDGSVIDLVNPVKKLTELVTGAIQIGFNWSSGRSNAEQQSGLERTITDEFQRGLTFDQQASAGSGARNTSSVVDTRTLAAVRNLTPNVQNLAEFSTSRQWRVAVVIADVRPVVFIPIDRAAEKFTPREVALHHAPLALALLDQSLRQTLDVVASDYDPRGSVQLTLPAPLQAGAEVKSIVGEISFSDPAEGRGSSVELRATFRDEGDQYVEFTQVFEHTSPGPTLPIQIEVNRPLSRYGGSELIMNNPGAKSDHTAGIRHLKLRANLSDDTTVVLHDTTDLVFSIDDAAFLASPRERRSDRIARRRPATDPRVARLLDHLNSRLAYYRLAIDLQRDSATRFERLVERAAEECGEGNALTTDLAPVDFDPLGVVGGYVAFPTAAASIDEPTRRSLGVGGRAQTFLMSTRAPGTYSEAIYGARAAVRADGATIPTIPSGPKESNVTYPWPDRVSPSQSTVGAVLGAVEARTAPGGGTNKPSELDGGTGSGDAAAEVRKEAETDAAAQAGEVGETVPDQPEDVPGTGAPGGADGATTDDQASPADPNQPPGPAEGGSDGQ